MNRIQICKTISSVHIGLAQLSVGSNFQFKWIKDIVQDKLEKKRLKYMEEMLKEDKKTNYAWNHAIINIEW